MDPTSYIAAAGMKANLRALEVMTNNIANADSPGFKVDTPFYAELEHAVDRLSGSSVPATFTDFSAGSMESTGNPLDLAINGDGFFTIRTPAGIAYTRNGSFSIGDGGEVVTQQGFQVLDSNGNAIPVALGPSQPNEIMISPNGNIEVDGNQISSLGIVTFDDPTQLTKLESQLFLPGGATVQPMVNPNIQQGTLEQSNANTIEMMIKMVELERMYDMNSRTIQTMMNEINRAAINGILGA